MAHRLIWSPQALADVEAIAEYIEKDSPFYARAVVAKIVAVTRHLGQFPLSGRIVPEKSDESFREVFAFSFRVIYRVDETTVMVVAVVHGKRLLGTV
ncbi:type II toxin-antitoxin system RelE/ParE family toxin [Geoalkalibacter halelectricus]|uniref:Type II toxin-antitoxin system RelE/ParE family toxin n=1 Tax=Geoalkalibacter halelectricus TaxID=2847045 RepID=A0ABY5ZKM4_9BACT|nr:type II toxin-antitoxin system RelE/ParE family toxin [Geoalkalibacter halelectricus]UWZ79695.1 type II toxin-antitoxin system RelE/ParE family toxin [Geoalkalibacter halelectricus]